MCLSDSPSTLGRSSFRVTTNVRIYTCSVPLSACKKIDRVNRRLTHQTHFSCQEQRAVQMQRAVQTRAAATAGVTKAGNCNTNSVHIIVNMSF